MPGRGFQAAELAVEETLSPPVGSSAKLFVMTDKEASQAEADDSSSDSGDSLDIEVMNKRHMEIFQRHASAEEFEGTGADNAGGWRGGGGGGGGRTLANRGYASIYGRR